MSSTTSTPITLRTTTNPTTKDIDTFLDLLSTSYLHTPLTTSFITEIDSTPPPYPSPSLTPSRLKSHFTLGITAVSKSNILLTFASSSDDSSSTPLAAALYEPPQFTGVPPSHARPTPGPILTSYRALAAGLKSTHLSIPESGPHAWDTPSAPSQASAGPSEDPYPGDFNKDASAEIRAFYHLAFLARRDGSLGREASRIIVLDVLSRARKEDVPVWLLVSDPGVLDEYLELGFRVVDQRVVGEGLVDGKGWPCRGGGGEGVKVWALIWEADR